MKRHRQHVAQFSDSNQEVENVLGKINNYHKIDNGNLEVFSTLRKNSSNFENVDGGGNIEELIKLISNASAYASGVATLSTERGKETEQYECVGPVSTIMRLLTRKNGDLLSYLERTDESQNGIESSVSNQILDIR